MDPDLRPAAKELRGIRAAEDAIRDAITRANETGDTAIISHRVLLDALHVPEWKDGGPADWLMRFLPRLERRIDDGDRAWPRWFYYPRRWKDRRSTEDPLELAALLDRVRRGGI